MTGARSSRTDPVAGLYQLPSYTREQHRALLLGTLCLLVLDLLVALSAATQYLAHRWSFHGALGRPLVVLASYPDLAPVLLALAGLLAASGLALARRSSLPLLAAAVLLPVALAGVGPLYPPWSFLFWSSRYGDGALRADVSTARLVLLVTLAVEVSLSLFCLRARLAALKQRGDVHGSSRFATPADLEGSNLLSAPHGIILGVWDRPKQAKPRYLIDGDENHVLVYAPPKAGKTTAIVIPTLLTWPGSALVLDIKGELHSRTAGYRKTFGRVVRFQPSCRDGSAARYNPLAAVPRGLGDVAHVQEIADSILNPDGREEGADTFWRGAAHELLVGLILHCLYAGPQRSLTACAFMLSDPARPIEETLVAMLATEHDPEGQLGFVDPLTGAPTRTHPVVAATARGLLQMHERTRAGVVATAQVALSLFRDPILASNTALCDFTPEDLFASDQPLTVYLVVPLSDVLRLRPVLRMIINQMLRRLTSELPSDPTPAARAGLRHELLLVLDELAQLGRLELFERALGLVRGYGIRALIAVQAISQLRTLYGHHESLTSNCRTQVVYAPADVETAQVISEMTGTTTVTVEREVRSGGPLLLKRGGATYSLNDSSRKLLTADEVRRLPADRCLVFSTGLPPVMAKRLPYFEDPLLSSRAGEPPPPQSDRIEHQLCDWTDHNTLLPISALLERYAGPPEPRQAAVLGPSDFWPGTRDRLRQFRPSSTCSAFLTAARPAALPRRARPVRPKSQGLVPPRSSSRFGTSTRKSSEVCFMRLDVSERGSRPRKACICAKTAAGRWAIAS